MITTELEQHPQSSLNNYNLRMMDEENVKITEFLTFDLKLNFGIHSLKFSNSDKYLAAGYRDGRVRIFNLETNSIESELNCNASSKNENIIQTLKWRPRVEGRTNNILMTACRDTLTEWHTPSKKTVTSFSFGEGKIILSAEYSNDGLIYAVGLSDCSIRIIDAVIQQEIKTLGGALNIKGHMNKVSALKFHKDDPNVLISAGWDDNILFWDLSAGTYFKVIVGPHIHGEGLDMNSFGDILTASWRKDDPLEVYDYETGQKRVIEWDFKKENSDNDKESDILNCQISDKNGENLANDLLVVNDCTVNDYTQLYCGRYSKDFGKLIFAGGSQVNSVGIFDWKGNAVGLIDKLPHACLALDSGNNYIGENEQLFAFGTGEGVVKVYKIKYGQKFNYN